MDKFITTRTRSESPIRTATPIYLGVLGSRNDMKMDELCEKLLHPLLETLERKPEKLLLPHEGTSNIYLSDWAERAKIPSKSYMADWKRDGKRARILRDNTIINEATHLVCFNGPRSVYYETMGAKLIKKKKNVFVMNYKEQELVQLEAE
jgi:hypothetical protein